MDHRTQAANYIMRRYWLKILRMFGLADSISPGNTPTTTSFEFFFFALFRSCLFELSIISLSSESAPLLPCQEGQAGPKPTYIQDFDAFGEGNRTALVGKGLPQRDLHRIEP